MSQRVRARARVTVTVEISLPSVWGIDCPMEQIMKQAKDDAVGALRGGLAIDGLVSSMAKTPIHGRIIDEPRVVAILAEELK